jgi:hypothetical protein
MSITGMGGSSQDYTLDPGTTEVELDIPEPGSYVIKLSCFPYLPDFFTVMV